MTPGIYQGWTGWRNLGDEAMFVSCQRALPSIDWTARPPFDARTSARSGVLRRAWQRAGDAWSAGRPALLGGGTLINRAPEWLDTYRRMRRGARKPVPVFSPGVANPEYWSGTPGWRDMRPAWREVLADLPEVGVRGPQSKRLLDEAGVRNVTVTGDPALLFHRSRRSTVPRKSIGINAGRSNGAMWGSEDRLIATLADAARRWRDAGFDVRLFPAWDQDVGACHEVARGAGLGPESVDALILDPDAFLDYVERFDVVVAVKLHASVLAAAAGVPFVAVEYRPKVRDFAESVGCAAQALRSDEVDGARMERAVLDLVDALPVARTRLHARVGELAETFRAYARRVEALLLS